MNSTTDRAETKSPAHPNPLDDAALSRLSSYLAANWQTPEAAIVRQFARRDVVLLAEEHRIKHNLLLAQALIPLLYQAGVYNFGMEFGASEDQARLDRLVTGEEYDEDLARRLMFNYNVGWAFREYVDIYRRAWELNRSLPAGSRAFRILNLSYRYDWTDAGPVMTPASARRIFHKGGTETYRAALARREILDRGEKILILTGTPHAFTRYRMPVYDAHAEEFYRLDDRDFGNLLHAYAPDRVCTVILHQAFPSKTGGEARLVYPARGAIDQVLAHFDHKRVGFDLVGAPFGDLEDASFYSTGREHFTLNQLADGYIYEKPFTEFEGCTIDEDFLAGADWAEVQRQWPDPHWHRRPKTLADYWAHVHAFADVASRYAQVAAE